jgi:hypothetical protein
MNPTDDEFQPSGRHLPKDGSEGRYGRIESGLAASGGGVAVDGHARKPCTQRGLDCRPERQHACGNFGKPPIRSDVLTALRLRKRLMAGRAAAVSQEDFCIEARDDSAAQGQQSGSSDICARRDRLGSR